MRFYGLHSGRNNMAGLLVRSYYYYKPKNKDITLKKNTEKQPNIIEDIIESEPTNNILYIISIIMMIFNVVFLLMIPFQFDFEILILISMGVLASFSLYKITKPTKKK